MGLGGAALPSRPHDGLVHNSFAQRLGLGGASHRVGARVGHLRGLYPHRNLVCVVAGVAGWDSRCPG